ncbi:uncharacterized protein LOC110049443 isoform X2 [Orbicella faveolata]|uniref:uncharacterized protein LOC110049443 isoform X2 n=1 Tax=Orbicella faveolata TaxID=48498 RepID=UPI0009E596FF|nr:uncharacterized protein LOC110049443 isoform X2 [Orbicella faveolata]
MYRYLHLICFNSRDQTPIFFLQDPILDLEISDQESEMIRNLAQTMAQDHPVPAQQDIHEWPGMVNLTNEVVSTRSKYQLIFKNVVVVFFTYFIYNLRQM